MMMQQQAPPFMQPQHDFPMQQFPMQQLQQLQQSQPMWNTMQQPGPMMNGPYMGPGNFWSIPPVQVLNHSLVVTTTKRTSTECETSVVLSSHRSTSVI